MDAVDITNLSTPPIERENRIVAKEDYVEENIDSVGSENVDVSFEDLICSMFDEMMEKKEVSFGEGLEDVENDVLLNGEILIDEDVDALIEVAYDERNLSEKVKDERAFVPLIDEDFEVLEGDIPVIECELELSSNEIKDKKEIKNTKEESSKKEEKEEATESVFPKDEHKNVTHSLETKVEAPKKVESKEENVEEVIDSVFEEKPKKTPKKLNISVEDLRTTPEVQFGEGAMATEEGQMGFFDGDASFSDAKNITSSQINTSNQKVEGNESVGNNQFSSILAEQIKANSAELVQRGKLILRDGNVGEIRLQLKPAHLGMVRINLKMTGNKKVQGEVTVSSKEAYDAFEDSMEELVSSFKDAGFDTSSFNLNWKGGKEEIAREGLRDKYFSPEKTALSLREKLNVTENIYDFGQAENVNVLA